MEDKAQDQDSQKIRKRNRPTHALVGLIILSVGTALLVDQLGFLAIPEWILSWQMFLIVLGVIVGVKKSFRGVGWAVMIAIGGFFLLQDFFFFQLDIRHYWLPVGIMVIGVMVLVRALTGPHPSSKNWNECDGPPWSRKRRFDRWKEQVADDVKKKFEMNDVLGEDYINQTNVFGSSKNRIFSKQFKGGETVNFFGGAEIDLTQADIEGRAVLDMVQVFGGVKLIIPANWTLKTESVAVLGGISDKRPPAQEDPDKVLIVTGTCIFGGLEIRSY